MCLESDCWLRTIKAEEDSCDLINLEQNISNPPKHLKIESTTVNAENFEQDGNSEPSKPKRNRQKRLNKSHMCMICGKTFFTSGHLRSHELTHRDSKDFICNSCGKKFLMKSYLNRHMKSHLNERNYKCKVCQKGFNTSTTLAYHFRLVHSGWLHIEHDK